MSEENPQKQSILNRVLYWIAAGVFAVFGGYYLWTQHRAHVFQYWPLALFLLFPLIHLFGGHGRCCGKHDHEKKENKEGGDSHA